MQQREAEARKSGRLGVFLNPREVGVVAAALTWARTDLAFAKRLLAERAPDHVKAEVPEELFTNWAELLESAHQVLVLHALSDCQERSDDEAKDQVEASIRELIEQAHQAQQITNVVRAAVLTADMQKDV